MQQFLMDHWTFSVPLFAALSFILVFFAFFSWRRLSLKRSWVELAQEIKDRKIAEANLLLSEQKFRDFAEATHEAIIASNQEGKIVYFNRSAEAMFGYSKREAMEHPITMLTPEANKKKFLDTLTTDGAVSAEVGLKRSGEEFPIEMSIVRSYVGGNFLSTSIIRDMTLSFKFQEELKRSNEALEQFAYIASHDMQEPLRTVINYLELLKKRYKNQLDADANEFMDFAIKGSQSMKEMIVDWLLYASMGKEALKERVDCEEVLNKAIENLKAAIQQSGAVITHDPLPTLTAVKSQFIQLFQNLLSNAIKFCGDEKPRIHVSAKEKGNEWVFAIRDEGIGIDPVYAERIFKFFQRLHQVEDRPGTGLGLSIARKIVENLNGRIWVESKVGEGSTFYFTVANHNRKSNERDQ